MTAPTPTPMTIPGYAVGTWSIDPSHSEIGFSVRHLMVSKVRGKFTRFEGEIETGAQPLDSRMTATIDLNSIDTGAPDRDEHLRSTDFFDVATHPMMTYRSTGVRVDGDGNNYVLEGELTLKGVTLPVPLRLEVGGFGPDPFGGVRAGFTAMGRDPAQRVRRRVQPGDGDRGRGRRRQGSAPPRDRGHPPAVLGGTLPEHRRHP